MLAIVISFFTKVCDGMCSFLFYQLRRLEVSWFQVLGTFNYDIRVLTLDLLHIVYGIQDCGYYEIETSSI